MNTRVKRGIDGIIEDSIPTSEISLSTVGFMNTKIKEQIDREIAELIPLSVKSFKMNIFRIFNLHRVAIYEVNGEVVPNWQLNYTIKKEEFNSFLVSVNLKEKDFLELINLGDKFRYQIRILKNYEYSR